MTPFQLWLFEFLDRHKVDVKTPIKLGDDSMGTIADVVKQILIARPFVQGKIKEQLQQFALISKNPVIGLFENYAQHMHKGMRLNP